MPDRRGLLIFVYMTAALALVGLLAFIGGLVVEAFRVETGAAPSPAVSVALAGLCAAALVLLSWFTVVGLLLARQTRAQGSGYGDAYRLIEQFRFRDAIPLLERSIREGKETADVLMLLTSAYAYTGQYAKAQFTADRAVERFPQYPESYITLANGYRLQGADDEAVRALMRAAELAPDQSVVWAELGFAQRYTEGDGAAVASFERATAHSMPDAYAVRVYYHLAQAYRAAGERERAARAEEKMLSARDGLRIWRAGLRALEGSVYGGRLAYEIDAIERAVAHIQPSGERAGSAPRGEPA